MDTGQYKEKFVDETENPIPPRNTWEELSNNELYAIKAQLQDKLWAFTNPTIVKTLQSGINYIELIISSRLVS